MAEMLKVVPESRKELSKYAIQRLNTVEGIKIYGTPNSVISFNLEGIHPHDVCTILEKCSIDEISKYILKKGKTKDFPDITIRK